MGSGWLKALEIRGASAFLGFIAFAVVSVGRELHWASLAELPGWASAAANVLAILFFVLSTPWLFRVVGHPVRPAQARGRRREDIRRQLQGLTMEEGLALWTTVATQHRSIFAQGSTFAPEQVGPAGLYNRGLVEVQASVGNGVMYFVRDDVWEVIGGQTAAAHEVVDQLRRRLRE